MQINVLAKYNDYLGIICNSMLFSIKIYIKTDHYINIEALFIIDF